MLNKDRREYVTASQAVNVMAGFETELRGRNAVKPDYDDFAVVEKLFTESGTAPLVSALKDIGVKMAEKDIKAICDYLKSQKKPFSAGMLTTALEIAAGDFFDSFDSNPTTKDMQNGVETEGAAVSFLAEKIGIALTATGDAQQFLSKGALGVTPDGIEMDGLKVKSCAEVKCPKAKTHMEYLYLIHSQQDLLDHRPIYYWQCQAGLAVTEADCYHWLSYCPDKAMDGYRGIYIQVEPVPEHIEILTERAQRVVDFVPVIKDKIINRSGLL